MSADFLATQENHKKLLNVSNLEVVEMLKHLPDKRFYEFGFYKLFGDPSARFNTWQDWKEWSYPIQDLIRFDALITSNKDLLEGKRVVDFACYIGYLSLMALHAGAQHVTATNVRQNGLDLAKEIIDAAGYNKQFDSILSDLHNYQDNYHLSQSADTVLLCGIMYHVHDHYQILESITSAGPSTIIIETREEPTICDLDSPLVWWKTEPTDSDVLGYYNDNKTVPVGYPNLAWFKLTMNKLGYQITRHKQIKMLSDIRGAYDSPATRSIQVYQKISQH